MKRMMTRRFCLTLVVVCIMACFAVSCKSEVPEAMSGNVTVHLSISESLNGATKPLQTSVVDVGQNESAVYVASLSAAGGSASSSIVLIEASSARCKGCLHLSYIEDALSNPKIMVVDLSALSKLSPTPSIDLEVEEDVRRRSLALLKERGASTPAIRHAGLIVPDEERLYQVTLWKRRTNIHGRNVGPDVGLVDPMYFEPAGQFYVRISANNQ